MSKPHVHARSSAKKFGGELDDYLEIHEFMDSSKSAIADNRHRALTHNSWFIQNVLTRVFGNYITNSNGRLISVAQIGEDHILEDFGKKFIPSAQDYLGEIEFKSWMNNGRGNSYPASYKKLQESKKTAVIGD